MRLLATPVEHAGDQAFPAQTPRVARSQRVPLLYLETYSLTGHGGGL
jgi:hypothetical protein